MRLVLLPIAPVASRVTFPVVVISAKASLAPMATIPPVPAVKLTLPPSAFKAGPLPWSSNTIVPAPLPDCTATMLTPGVAAGVTLAKVIGPVCVLSPKVSVAVGVVSICANSAGVMLMPLGV